MIGPKGRYRPLDLCLASDPRLILRRESTSSISWHALSGAGAPYVRGSPAPERGCVRQPTASLWQPCRLVRVVAATTSLGPDQVPADQNPAIPPGRPHVRRDFNNRLASRASVGTVGMFRSWVTGATASQVGLADVVPLWHPGPPGAGEAARPLAERSETRGSPRYCDMKPGVHSVARAAQTSSGASMISRRASRTGTRLPRSPGRAPTGHDHGSGRSGGGWFSGLLGGGAERVIIAEMAARIASGPAPRGTLSET
jgi:hypothetical protein